MKQMKKEKQQGDIVPSSYSMNNAFHCGRVSSYVLYRKGQQTVYRLFMSNTLKWIYWVSYPAHLAFGHALYCSGPCCFPLILYVFQEFFIFTAATYKPMFPLQSFAQTLLNLKNSVVSRFHVEIK